MKKMLGIVLCYLFVILPVFASPVVTNTSLGNLEKNNIVLDFNGYTVETYKVLDSYYVPVTRLKDAGLIVHFTPDTGTIQITPPAELPIISSTNTPSTFENTPFSLYQSEIWIGTFKTHSIVSNGRALVPIGALRSIYDITIESNTLYHMTQKIPLPITATQKQIINQTEYPLTISVTDLYWDNAFINETFDYTLNPGETFTRPTPSSSKKYITTIVTKADSQSPQQPFSYTNNNMFGQLNETLFRYDTRIQTLGMLADMGDPIDVNTILWAENMINSKHLSSATPYLSWTSIEKQRTYIFQGSKDNWKLIKHFKCSTGRPGADTPKGQYKLTYKVPYFGVEKGYRCKNAFGFIGTTYLYHSVMFDKSGTYLLKGKGTLGKKASAGCIRLSVEHSEWFYNNMKSGSTVLIS